MDTLIALLPLLVIGGALLLFWYFMPQPAKETPRHAAKPGALEWLGYFGLNAKHSETRVMTKPAMHVTDLSADLLLAVKEAVTDGRVRGHEIVEFLRGNKIASRHSLVAVFMKENAEALSGTHSKPIFIVAPTAWAAPYALQRGDSLALPHHGEAASWI